MKLNDPFGRLERRHQAGYEAMRASLRQAGIDTPQAVRAIIAQAWQRGLRIAAAALVLALLMGLLLPRLLPLTLALALFVVVWVVTSSINGRRYLQRYLDEELKD